MELKDDNSKYLPYSEIIDLAKAAGVAFGKGYPYNRLRYYTKIGLLPHAKRKAFGGPPEGAYPTWVVDKLVEIDEQIKVGRSIQSIIREQKETTLVETGVPSEKQPEVIKPKNVVDVTPEKPGFTILPTLRFASLLLFIIGTFGLIAYNLPPINSHFSVPAGKSLADSANINRDELNNFGQILARTTSPFFAVNVPTSISGLLTASGGIETGGADIDLGTGEITASNILLGLTGGSNLEVGTGQNPTIDISNTYAGQTSITTLGTIGTGSWNGTPISDTFVDNGLTIDGTGSVNWGALNAFPSDCAATDFVRGVGATLTCAADGSGAATLQDVYDNGNIILTAGGRDIEFDLSVTNEDFIVDLEGAGNILDVRDSTISFLTLASGQTITTSATSSLGINGSLDLPATGITGAGAGSGLDADLLDGITSANFLRSNTSDNFTSGTLTTNAGTILDIDGTLAWGGATISEDLNMANNLITNIGAAGTDFTSGGGLTLSDTLTVNQVNNPTIAGTVNDATNLNGAKNVYVSGRYAYVTAYNGSRLTVVDISNPTSPTVVGNVNDATNLSGADGIHVSGRYAYVTANADDRLTVVDISDPTSPTVAGTIQDATNLDGASGVYVSGKYAYLASFNSDSLTVVDISDPTSPTIAGTVTDATNLNGASQIHVSGRYAYVTAYNGSRLTVVDISNPTSPTVVGNVNDATNLFGPEDVYVSGRYAYVAVYIGNRLTVVDISDPTSPTVVGNILDNTNLNSAYSVYVSGRYAYVADYEDYLTVVDISDPTSPTVVGSIQDNTNLDGVTGVYVSGKYAYLASRLGNRLTVVDVTGLDVPTITAGNINTNTIDTWDNLNVGNNLYVRNGINTGLGGLYASGPITTSSSLSVLGNTYFEGGNVGIGTSTPSENLEVTGSPTLVTNGTFDSNVSSWNNVGGSTSYQSGTLRITVDAGGGIDYFTQSVTVEVGKKYLVKWELTDAGTSTDTWAIFGTAEATGIGYFSYDSQSSFEAGTYSHTLTATGTTLWLNFGIDGSSGNTADWDNISVEEVGNASISGSLDFTTYKKLITVFEGDSQTDPASLPWSWARQLKEKSSYFGKATDTIYAVSGEAAADMVGEYATEAHTKRPMKPGDEGWFFLYAGPNDIIQGETDESVIYGYLTTLWANARADGFKVVAFTVPPASVITGAGETTRQNLNTLILSNPSLYDFVIRPEIIFPDSSDTNDFFDGVHLTSDASARLATLVNTTIFYQPWQLYPTTVATGPTNMDLILNPTGGNVDIPGTLAVGSVAVPVPGWLSYFSDSFDGSTCAFNNCVGNYTNLNINTADPSGFAAAFAGQVSTTNDSFTLTDAIAFRAVAAVDGGASVDITNTYGLYVEDMTAGTNDYGIYIAGADTYALWVDNDNVRFDDDLLIGEGSATDDDYIYFDQSNEFFLWDDAPGEFDLSDDLNITGGLTASAASTINGTLAVLGTDGTDDDFIYFDSGTAESISWDESDGEFDFSNEIDVTGTGQSDIAGSLRIDGVAAIGANSLALGNVGLWVSPNLTDLYSVSSGIYINPTLTTSHTNNYGINITNPGVSGPGAVTNNYGLYINNQTIGTNDYGIYIGGADTYALWVDAGPVRLDGLVSVGLGTTASTTAVCSSLANATAPTAGVAYELQDCNATPAADYMEMYPVSNSVKPGDLVMTGDNYVTTKDGEKLSKLVKTSSPYDSKILGVVSNPKDAGDFNSIGYNIKEEDNPLPIALNGRVNVKISTENGDIEPGNPLTSSSLPGVAMKATKSGPIVGKALASYSGSGVGKIITYISVGWYVAPIENGWSLATATTPILGDLPVSLSEEGDILINGNLVVNGNINLSGNLRLDGTLSAGVIETKSLKILASDEPTTGNSTIKKGTLSVKISSTSLSSGSKVFVTPTTLTGGQPLSVTDKRPGEYFVVEIESTYSKDIFFDWWVVN